MSHSPATTLHQWWGCIQPAAPHSFPQILVSRLEWEGTSKQGCQCPEQPPGLVLWQPNRPLLEEHTLPMCRGRTKDLEDKWDSLRHGETFSTKISVRDLTNIFECDAFVHGSTLASNHQHNHVLRWFAARFRHAGHAGGVCASNWTNHPPQRNLDLEKRVTRWLPRDLHSNWGSLEMRKRLVVQSEKKCFNENIPTNVTKQKETNHWNSKIRSFNESKQ